MPDHPDCIFCKIADHSIPVTPLFEDEHTLAFTDQNPQAPTHFLVIPRQHFANVTIPDVTRLGNLLHTAAALGRRLLPGGHRIVINTGTDGGQTVDHLHLHVLGGRSMSWPPG